MDIEKIGLFIKELRKEKNISQNQLSEEIHVTRQAISNWENGKAVPDSDILLLLSTYFNVSINEILLGKRHSSKEGLEKITLQLIDDHNKKTRKIKRLIRLFGITIVLFLLIFLSYYFINNYNSIKVYQVNGYSEKFKTHNGIFVTTNKKMYLRLGKISKIGHENNEINKVKLYYLNEENKNNILFEKNGSEILIDENCGYKEYFLTNNMNRIINNLYLEITYNKDQKEIIKLNFTERFKNTYDFFKRNTNIKLLKIEDNLKKTNSENETMNQIEKFEIESIKKEAIEQKKTRDLLDSKNKLPEQNTDNYLIQYDTNNNEQPYNLNQNSQDNNQEKSNIIKNEEKTTKEENTENENNIKESNPSYNIINDDEKEKIEDNKVEDIKETEENENITENEIIIENKIEDENKKIEIDYEEIINIICENGIKMRENIFMYDLNKDNKYYSLYYEDDLIVIDIMYDNIYENIQLFINKETFSYQKYIDYNETKKENGPINDNLELILRINSIFIQ